MAAAEELYFMTMDEAELRHWVKANPARVNARDVYGITPLVAAERKGGLSLVVWLLEEKGADVNGTTERGKSALHLARSLDILTGLLDRGADLTMADSGGGSPVMWHAARRTVEMVAHLLQDPRVRATINMQDTWGNTALHNVCKFEVESETAAGKARLLLQAGLDLTTTENAGRTPLDVVRERYPHHHAVIALLEQTQAEAEKA